MIVQGVVLSVLNEPTYRAELPVTVSVLSAVPSKLVWLIPKLLVLTTMCPELTTFDLMKYVPLAWQFIVSACPCMSSVRFANRARALGARVSVIVASPVMTRRSPKGPTALSDGITVPSKRSAP